MKNQKQIAETLRELKERSGLSWTEIAVACGYKTQSSIQRFYTEGGNDKNYLPVHIIDGLLKSIVGKGQPPITDEEIMYLAPLMGFHTANPDKPAAPSGGFSSAPYTGSWAGIDKIPVVAYAAASGERVAINLENDLPIKFIERPHWLVGVPKAAAVQIIGESMSPRYRDGEIVFINMSAPVLKGKDCIFNTRDGYTHIKQFIKNDKDFYYFHQWNPDKEFSIHRREIESIYQIVGRE